MRNLCTPFSYASCSGSSSGGFSIVTLHLLGNTGNCAQRSKSLAGSTNGHSGRMKSEDPADSRVTSEEMTVNGKSMAKMGAGF